MSPFRMAMDISATEAPVRLQRRFDGPRAELSSSSAIVHSHAVPASFAFFPEGHGRQQ